ncbi:MAG: glutamyl-tRNA amidotransferase [Desulfobacteraceae bacterium 4572_35.1]|nr:MAG: glutamyl-tRNA amidotransferase [Desulfobacteraceae bacterium 4572_35.1]
MSIAQQLNTAMKEAMKSRQSERLGVIRLIRSAIKNVEIDKKIAMTDADIIAVMSTLVKQRRESAKIYRENERVDLAEKEEREIEVLQEFLPQQLSEEELQQLIEATITEIGATSMKEMGAVMKKVTPQTVGRADGRLVSEIVKRCLS